MSAPCNHGVVGILPRWRGRYLTGLRTKAPKVIAPPAGHVDELGTQLPTGAAAELGAYAAAAVRELAEETGITVRPGELRLALNQLGPDRCHRPTYVGGDNWHHWVVYIVDFDAQPDVRGNGELVDLTWRHRHQLAALPNLEPVWRTWLTTLRII